MYIFVGSPGVGKTTWYMQNLAHKGYEHINQDTLKTKAKVLKAIESNLSLGNSIAIDATNPSISTRKEYIDIARSYGITPIIIYFVNNGYERNKLRISSVPDIAYNMYFSRLQEPSESIDGVPVITLET